MVICLFAKFGIADGEEREWGMWEGLRNSNEKVISLPQRMPEKGFFHKRFSHYS